MQPSIASVQYQAAGRGVGKTLETDGLSDVLIAGPDHSQFSEAKRSGARWEKASPQEILEVHPEEIKTVSNFACLFKRFGQRGKAFGSGDEKQRQYPAARVYLARIQKMVVQQGTYQGYDVRDTVIARSDALISAFKPCSTGNHVAGGGCACGPAGID